MCKCVIILNTRCMLQKRMKQINQADYTPYCLRAPCSLPGMLWVPGSSQQESGMPSNPSPHSSRVPALAPGPGEGVWGEPDAGIEIPRAPSSRPGPPTAAPLPVNSHGASGCAAMQLRHETVVAFPSARGHTRPGQRRHPGRRQACVGRAPGRTQTREANTQART
jgi:hypothetical protein